MADQEQLERLKRSIEEWNFWRQRHPEIRPDLSSASLSYADLINADLHYADLSHTDLRYADLVNADLRGAHLFNTDFGSARLLNASLNDTYLVCADFFNANLSGANFTRADLGSACLVRADLSSAHLINADLHYAYLVRADLTNANFNQTILRDTVFAWVDLGNVKGLETARHLGPSTINLNSVLLPSDESARLHFLRGVGFTETQIEYLPSLLVSRPIEYASLFISCAHQDEAIAKQLYTDLRKKDVPCWFAPHDLRPGTLVVRGIEEAIHAQDKLLLILSHHAVASPWVQYEVETALHKQVTSGRETLFPVRLDNTILESNTEWAKRLCKHHIGDFTNWQNDAAYQQAFSQLLRDLKVTRSPTE